MSQVPSPVVIRVGHQDRFTHLTAFALAQAGRRVDLFDADARGQVRPTERRYYEALHELPGVRFVDGLAGVAEGAVLVDQCMDGRHVALPFRAIVYQQNRREPVRFHPAARYCLALLPQDDDRVRARALGVKLRQSPYASHPLLLAASFAGEPTTARPIHLLFAGTPNVEHRVRLLDRVRAMLSDEPFFVDVTSSPALVHAPVPPRRFVFSRGRVVSFEQWPRLLCETRWLLDVPGFKPITHRVVEGCQAGCALVLHERSAAVYDPPFRSGVDCLTYDDRSLVRVIHEVMLSDDALPLRLASAAQRRLGRSFGPAAMANYFNQVDAAL
jgi:hypothetical protein